MAVNPQIITTDVTFTWDGSEQRLAKNTVLDVQPGSALEAAIGTENLRPQLLPGSTAAVLPADGDDSGQDGEQDAAAPTVRKGRKAQDNGDDKDGAS